MSVPNAIREEFKKQPKTMQKAILNFLEAVQNRLKAEKCMDTGLGNIITTIKEPNLPIATKRDLRGKIQ